MDSEKILDILMKTDVYICLDFETTGLDPLNDGIIEIGKIEGEVIDYDEVEKRNAEVKVKRHKDL